MKCPVDNATLVMSERSGIEIDYCPDCRGVWLDRGELDKIVQGSSREQNEYSSGDHRREENSYSRGSEDGRGQHDSDNERRHDDEGRGYNGKKKEGRGSFIGDIFGGFGD